MVKNINNEEFFKVTESEKELNDKIELCIKNHIDILKNIINDPLDYYNQFCIRFETEGLNANFPEFEYIIDFLINNIKLKLLIIKDDILINLAYIKLINLYNICYQTKQKSYIYGESIRVIVNTLEFFDIYERKYNGDDLGVYYHNLNYQYYLNNLLDIKYIKKCIFFPTISTNIGATDFINLRPVPIYMCGVTTTKTYVDEFYQSPLEFFMHDMNHSRRMYEKSLDKSINDSLKFKDEMNVLLHINKTEDEDVKGLKQLIKMIIFEIVHEDALFYLPEIIWNALHRQDDYVYVFERSFMNKSKLDVKDHPINVEGALAYTKFKLQYQFYDNGDKDYIVKPKYRYANYIAIATIIILKYIKKIYQNEFEKHEIKDYEYYLRKTSSNNLIPKPIHSFKVKNDFHTYDVTSLKTGLPQNFWKEGYRRYIGEHLTDCNNYEVEDINYIASQFDQDAHYRDIEILNQILKKFYL